MISPLPAEGLPQTWSVCIEVGIYFLLPLMVLGIGWVVARVPRKAQPARALAILGCIGLLSIGLIGWGYPRAPLPAGPPRSELPLVVLRRDGARRPHRSIRRHAGGLTGWARAHPGGCWAVALVPFALALWLGPFGPAGRLTSRSSSGSSSAHSWGCRCWRRRSSSRGAAGRAA